MPTVAVAGLGFFLPACCCGGRPNPPPTGPPGSISGEILLRPGTAPSALAVYAVDTDAYHAFDTRYVMTRVAPPASTYHLEVPPGDYVVTARLDSNPLIAAGHLICPPGSDCTPAVSRLGYLPCQTISCQPVLAPVRVNAGQGVTHVDIGDWGSLYALERVWELDEFGAPGPFSTVVASAARVSPSSAPLLPVRSLPSPSTQPLSSEFHLPYGFDTRRLAIRLHLPGGWHAIANPAQEVEVWQGTRDFANQAVRSPLMLDGDGVWLTVDSSELCPPLTTPGGTAQASFGAANLYFEDPHSPMGQQPFSGYAVVGTMPAGGSCLLFRMTALSDQSRESNLATFIAIVEQAQYVI